MIEPLGIAEINELQNFLLSNAADGSTSALADVDGIGVLTPRKLRWAVEETAYAYLSPPPMGSQIAAIDRRANLLRVCWRATPCAGYAVKMLSRHRKPM